MFKFISIVCGYYLLLHLCFFQNSPSTEYPILKDRFGTTLWHTSDVRDFGEVMEPRVNSIYCYYPKASALYPNKGGEYILKKAAQLSDCKNFYGIALFHESPQVSEREKFWWRDDKLL